MKIKSIIILLILLITLPLAALERAGIEMTGMPMINVNISGFVRNPGSYRMMMGDNLITALERADFDELIQLCLKSFPKIPLWPWERPFLSCAPLMASKTSIGNMSLCAW